MRWTPEHNLYVTISTAWVHVVQLATEKTMLWCRACSRARGGARFILYLRTFQIERVRVKVQHNVGVRIRGYDRVSATHIVGVVSRIPGRDDRSLARRVGATATWSTQK